MWVVVKFEADDVAAVPFVWVIIDDVTGQVTCFWPNKQAHKKRSRKLTTYDTTTDGLYYPCKLLMDGAKFKTFKEALKYEGKAQVQSTVEQSTSDEQEPKKRKRIPKKTWVSEESSRQSKKKPKRVAKKPTSSEESSGNSSEEDTNEALEDSTDQYVFKKSRTIRLRSCYRHFGPTKITSDNSTDELVNPSIEDPKIVNTSTTTEHVNKTTENVISTTEFVKPIVESKAENGNNFVVSNITDITDSPVSDRIDLNVEQYCSSTFSAASIIGEIIDLAKEQIAVPTYTVEQVGESSSTYIHSTVPLSENMQLVPVVEDTNFFMVEFKKLSSKLDLLLTQQEGFKTTIVDLTYKMLKMEEQISKLQAPQPVLNQELSIPMKTLESFSSNEAALLASSKTTEHLVSYICSVNLENDLDSYIKTVFRTLFDLDFFLKKIIWSAMPDKIFIKNTAILECIVRAIRSRFRDLNMDPKTLDDLIYNCAKKLKDCQRKKKPEEQAPTAEEQSPF